MKCVYSIQSNLSYSDSCYPGTSLNRAADSLYFILILQKLWAVQWVWPIYWIRTNLSYKHPLIPRHSDKRGLTVFDIILTVVKFKGSILASLTTRCLSGQGVSTLTLKPVVTSSNPCQHHCAALIKYLCPYLVCRTSCGRGFAPTKLLYSPSLI